MYVRYEVMGFDLCAIDKKKANMAFISCRIDK